MITYYMSCGCIISKDELIRQDKKPYRTCPFHTDAKIIRREVVCLDCKKPFWAKKIGKDPAFCPGCHKVRQTTRCRNFQRAKAAKEHQRPIKTGPVAKRVGIEETPIKNIMHTRSSEARFDCIFRNKCMADILLNNPHADYLPCHGCRRYTSGFKVALGHGVAV